MLKLLRLSLVANLFLLAGCIGGAEYKFESGKQNNDTVDVDWAIEYFGLEASTYAWFISLAKDNSGHIYMNGQFDGDLTFQGVTYPGHGGADVFLAKMKISTKEVVWLKTFGGTSHEWPYGLQINHDDEVFFSATFRSPTINIGAHTLTRSVTSTQDGLLMKLDPLGNALWVKQITPTTNRLDVYQMALDSDGNPYICGSFDGSTLDYGGGLTRAAVDGYEGFFAKYDGSNGDVVWNKLFSGVGRDEILNLTIDENDNVIVGGFFTNSVNRGDGTILNSANTDLLLMKYNSAGVHQWTKTFPAAAGALWSASLITDSSGDIFFGFGFESDIEIGGVTYTADGGASQMFGKFSGSNGSPVWVKQLDDIGIYDWGLSLNIDSSGNLLVLGTVYGSLDLEGNLITPTAGEDAIYLAKYKQNGEFIWHRAWHGPWAGAGNGYYSDPMIIPLDDGRIAFHGWFKTEIEMAGGTLSTSGPDYAGVLVLIDDDGQDHL